MIGLLIIGITSLSTFKRIQTIELLAAESSEIEVQMLKIRKHEKDFLAREVKDPAFFNSGNSKYASKFEDDHAIVENMLEILKNSRYIKNHNYLGLVDSIENSFLLYENIFLEITNNSLERGYKDWGLVGELRNAIHNVEQDIKDIELDNAYLTEMLMLRRHEKDYFIRSDLKYQDKFHNQIVSLKSKIDNNSNLSTDEKLKFNNYLDAYKDKFNAVIAMDKEIGLSENEGHMGEMRDAIHEVEPLVERLVHSLRNLAQTNISRSTTILWILISLISIISVFNAYLIGKAIYKQLGTEPSYLVKIAESIANGNLNINSKEHSTGILASIQKMASQLREIIDNINNGSDHIKNASEEASSSAQQLSQGANEQAASIEEVSATMEQIASNIQNNANNANETENISKNAFDGIQNVNKASQESLKSIQDIANKITIITDIAFQTNILALNAAVEAARAGEHGKGFAVVAAEVRKLAERSKDAAKEIVELAGTSVETTKLAAEQLNKILPDIEKTSMLIAEISAASDEQRNGTDQVNNAIQQLNSVTQQNSASSEELASNSEELNSQAEELRELIKYFKL